MINLPTIEFIDRGFDSRVAGLDVGVMSLRELTWAAMVEQSKVLCRICGHWAPAGRLNDKVTATGEGTGPFWAEALERWKREKPKLRIYGDEQ